MQERRSPLAGLPELAAGLPPTLPLWSLKLSLTYYSSSLGLALQTLSAVLSKASESECMWA
jgi:hypothetical protein